MYTMLSRKYFEKHLSFLRHSRNCLKFINHQSQMSWSEKFSLFLQYKSLNSSSNNSPNSSTSYFCHHLKQFFIIFSIIGLISLYLIASYRQLELNFTQSTIQPSTVAPSLLPYDASTQPDYSKYLIYTPQCIIPNIPVFNAQTRKLYQKYKSKHYQCAKPDVTVNFRRVNYTYVQVPANLSCTAREIVRQAWNENVAFGKVFAFPSNQTVMNFPTSDAVEVTCNWDHKRIIPLVPKKEPIWSLKSRVNPILPHSPNVLMVGIDSVSRLNFLRHFNETAKFIKEKHFEGPLYGLQKVGDNTWPNLMAMFTGEPRGDSYKALPQNHKLDRLPLIFKSFSQAGYLTTYIENTPKYGLWTYHGRAGFTQQPFEYFLRPVNLLVYKELNHLYCYKEKLELELYYDYVYDQMAAFRERRQKHFTFVHMTAVTHNILNHAQYVDHPVEQFLARIFDSNLHNDTLIVFYSDHGIRFGDILYTESGFQESRMPFMYFYIPKGMRLLDSDGEWIDEHKLKQVFRGNARRVTSNFDIHATLRHVINRAPSVDEYYGQSLFTPISNQRTCGDAGIPDEYCLCRLFEPLNSTKVAQTVADFTLQYLNTQLKPYKEQCHQLSLARVIKAKVTSHLNSSGKKRPKRLKRIFTITIVTSPSNGTFEATIQGFMTRDDKLDKKSLQMLGQPLRQDRYGEQSYCVANTPVESMCYCREVGGFTTGTFVEQI